MTPGSPESTAPQGVQEAHSAPAPRRGSEKEQRRVFISSFLGSAVEFYDFMLYGAAAGLVFPKLFFDESLDPVLGTLLSYIILFAGYLARPVGGLLFGHLGDRFGRKNILFMTMLIMGLVSVGIGLMPTYHTIGAAAPIILVALRVIQGVAVGGEWAGATLMAAEHAGEHRKGFAASVAVAGAPAGTVMSTLVLGLFSGLPEEQFLAWGWRLPFLLSVALVIIGLYMRARLKESPEFEAARLAGEVHTGVPLLRIFTHYPKATVLSILAMVAPLFMQALMAVFMVPYVVGLGAISQQTGLMLLTFSAFLHIFAIPLYAALSDRLGRSRVLIGGAVVSIALTFPMLAAMHSTSAWLVGIGFLLGNIVIQASMYGPVGAFLADKFETRDRYTGLSFTYQAAAVLGAGLCPIVSVWLVERDAGGTNLIGWYFIALAVIAAVSVYFAERTKNAPKVASTITA